MSKEVMREFISGADVDKQVGLKSEEIGFGEKPAFLVIDLQHVLTNPSSGPGTDLGGVIVATNELIEYCDETNVPVVFVRNVPYPNRARIGTWAKLNVEIEDYDPDEGAGQLDKRLKTKKDHIIIDKHQMSAFHETALESLLTHWGVDTLILSGCSTSGCVRATATDSCARGYRTIVPVSCVGDRSNEQAAASLIDIQARIGDVVDHESVLEYLLNL